MSQKKNYGGYRRGRQKHNGDAADLSVPIVVDTGHGKNWDEAH